MPSDRTPVMTIVVEFHGRKRRRFKIELFDAMDWPDGFFPGVRSCVDRYRVRVNRRWWSADGVHPTCLTYRQAEKQLWASSKGHLWLASFQRARKRNKESEPQDSGGDDGHP